MSNDKVDEPRSCPQCRADLRGEPIPAASREHFGGATHFKREIGLYAFDVTVGFQCPDCGHRWARPGFEDRFARSGAADWPEPDPAPDGWHKAKQAGRHMVIERD